VGDQVINALKAKSGFEKYSKGQTGIYTHLKDKLADAINHATQLRKHCQATGSINPATEIDELILTLKSLNSYIC
jgi:hypothetical protein